MAQGTAIFHLLPSVVAGFFCLQKICVKNPGPTVLFSKIQRVEDTFWRPTVKRTNLRKASTAFHFCPHTYTICILVNMTRFGCHVAVSSTIAFTICSQLGAAKALASGFGKSSTKKNKDKSAYSVDDSLSTKYLLNHLIEVEECEGLETLDIGFNVDTNLRGLYSRENFQKGEYICTVPFVSTIQLDETFFPTPEPNDEMKLSASRLQNAVRFLELVGKAESPLESLYRNSLPWSSDDPNFSPTPDFWSTNEIKELQVPCIVSDMLARKEQARTYDGADGPLKYTVEELMHAMWLVRSRAFTTLKKAITLEMTEGLLQRTVMIPFFDLLNHKRSCNAKIEVMETKEYEASIYALVAERNIQKGEEITICYGTGEEPSWELYCKYGFWPEGHGENDQNLISEVVEPDCWTTTLDQDLTALKKFSGGDSINRSILDFRVRLKKAERTML